MTKPVTTPATKPATTTSPVTAPTPVTAVKATAPVATPASPATVKPTVPAATSPAPATTTEPKKIDLNKPAIKDAIGKGLKLIKEGKSKADAAMVIFEALKGEGKEVVIAAFVQGATLTDKGAVTYFYNCTRKSKKLAKST